MVLPPSHVHFVLSLLFCSLLILASDLFVVCLGRCDYKDFIILTN